MRLYRSRNSFPVSENENLKFLSSADGFFSNLLGAPSELQPNMGLFWSKYRPKNFGDWIGPYLYNRKTGTPPRFQRSSSNVPTIFSAGSIFRHIKAPNSAIVWGSGVISADDRFAKPKEILAVRGKLTRDICIQRGISCPPVYGDPGLILPMFYQPKCTEKKFSIGFIPHFKEYESLKGRFQFDTDEILIIDVTKSMETVIDQIVSCRATISSSLHGLIVSHAYQIPSGWARFTPPKEKRIIGDEIKYYDYFSSFDAEEVGSCLDMSGGETWSSSKILLHIKDTPIPDSAHLASKLLEVCPF